MSSYFQERGKIVMIPRIQETGKIVRVPRIGETNETFRFAKMTENRLQDCQETGKIAKISRKQVNSVRDKTGRGMKDGTSKRKRLQL